MGLEIGLWRVDDTPVRVGAAEMPLESKLEELIEADPTILGEAVLLIGRQVPTADGKFIDLLGIDADGVVHVLELKRNRTPREVVAQVLDYGSWVVGLGQDEIRSIFASYRSNVEFDEAFAKHFGVESPPDELNTDHKLTVIASSVDPATERIVTYLATRYGVPVNVAFFRYFVDEGRSYLARTWLLNDVQVTAPAGKRRDGGSKEPWNGQDWYVSFGDDPVGSRAWEDARRFGFVSAGGGEWYSRSLRGLPVGARIFTCIPKTGYVGVGVVTGEARPADAAVLEVDGQAVRFRSLDLEAPYAHPDAPDDGTDRAEYVVPVTWTTAVDRTAAVWKPGMFANEHSACRLRSSFTLEEVAAGLSLDTDE